MSLAAQAIKERLEGWISSWISAGMPEQSIIQLNNALNLFLTGYDNYEKTGETPRDAYVLMRQLFCLSNGFFNDLCADGISSANRPYIVENPDGVLGKLSDVSIENIISSISRDGFYVFQEKLPENIVNTLVAHAESTNYSMEMSNGHYDDVKYDRNNPVGNRYIQKTKDTISHPVIQKLISDSSILAIANSYLNTKSIMDSAQIWWLTDFSKSKEALDKSALMYHFDMDRIKFLKFFFYLTDVTSETAPHCYVKGSCARKPTQSLRDGRFSDEEISSLFPREDIREICGKKGTIIAVDTRGFHKGKAVEKGERLIFQLEFTNSLFGAPLEIFELENAPVKELSDAMRKYPGTYKLVQTPKIEQIQIEHNINVNNFAEDWKARNSMFLNPKSY